jgi:hypothetical protein
MNETDLKAALDYLDSLVQSLLTGEINQEQFREKTKVILEEIYQFGYDEGQDTTV